MLQEYIYIYIYCFQNLRFLHRHADADLLSVITSTVPPMDLSKVMIFNIHLLKYSSEVRGMVSNPKT